LGNPFHVDWPAITLNLQENILSQLITLLDGVAAYYQCARNARKKARLAANSSDQKQDVTESNTESCTQPTSTPPITLHITLGINEVTKALEAEIRSSYQVVVTADTTSDTSQPLTSVIFICHADLDNPAIVAHLPQLIALCNSARPRGHKIKVVLLPAGAQSSIAHALGYPRRVSVMALDNSTPGLDQLEPLLATVIDHPASWSSSIEGTALEPSHIKQLLTTAPKDMKAAKERRMQGRAAAKERRRTKSQLARVGTGS
jgi:ribonuclease P/MRP protein subunit POP3